MILTEYQQKTIDRALEKLMDENKQLKTALLQKTQELSRYHDAEKDGRLIELPCKEGDIVYSMRPDGNIVKIIFNNDLYDYKKRRLAHGLFLDRAAAEAAMGEKNEV